jgi:cytochrome c biogenesis factor
VVAIELAFARDDFSLNIVAQHSSTDHAGPSTS